MKFVEKCPKCAGVVQTKSLKKSIGLGFVKIPVSQFCLNPSCDWYQDFSEARSPEEPDQDVLQLKIPVLIKHNMLVVKGAATVILLSIFLIFILSFLRP